MAGVFVDGSRRPGHRQLTFPRPRSRGGVVDLELIEQRIFIEQAEPLDQMQIAIPAEVAACVAVKAAAIVEVRGVYDERCAFPAADRIAFPQPDARRKMRPVAETNED